MLRLLAAMCGLALASHAEEAAPLRVLDAQSYLLGALGQREWSSLDGLTPHGRSLDLRFQARSNAQAATLFIRQKDVKLLWPVVLNGTALGKLVTMEADQVSWFKVPEGLLKDGENILSIRSPGAMDDIFVGEFRLDERPPEIALHEASVHVEVAELEGRSTLPCRLTLVDAQGALAPLTVNPGQRLAARTGVVYTGDGRADLQVPAGSYTLYATRGMEYSLAEQSLTLSPGQHVQVKLELVRQVIAPHWAACDTHVHTLTYSGHGDCTAEERALTLAGEGIDLAISTEHNRYESCQEALRTMHVEQDLTNVVGDEVTTPAGHFNVFPVKDPHAPQPDFKLTDWPALMTSIRATAQPQVIILNHPRDVHNGFIPFDPVRFDAVTGDHPGPEFTFDAVEVVNSGSIQSDVMQSFRDWFALLNHGCRVTAVGSSDSHDVSRYIVGQGRSYVDCDRSTPGHIPVDAACRAFKEGRVCVSEGLLTTMTVNRRAKVGDLISVSGETLEVDVTVQGPSWIEADKVELFANGLRVRVRALPAQHLAGVKALVHWTLPKPAHDVYLVAIATGPGVTGPYWKLAPPYQPTSRELNPRVIGATNPVWVDADGDGRFTSPRGYAEALFAQFGTDPPALAAALQGYDAAVAAQMESVRREKKP